MFKEARKHTLGSPHQKRECGASLNARELTREKKFHMDENLFPKHFPNRKTPTSKKYTCKFKRGPKLTSLKSQVSIV